VGERLKEASCINLSLTTLNHVIMSICRGQRAPPFRDSVLTRLLQVCALGSSCMLFRSSRLQVPPRVSSRHRLVQVGTLAKACASMLLSCK
jgi:hypothetical protein